MNYAKLLPKFNKLIMYPSSKIEFGTCVTILEKIFARANVGTLNVNLIAKSSSKLLQVYDYPLLVALPYDRLIMCQFSKIQCSDGQWAQGVMVNGKHYSLNENAYKHMSQLKIDRDSIIQLRFNV
ncbi:unnamed protein product [Didymodactylos carnosus]|uniref:Uncharacterized protein n=1 Tax=Didymodactylos carnosus TaxID=1234261 RepID=A0A814NIB5_9BILA|nr:unnamed protein product [Didymodactylos carnosus]CAF3858789.1 unnamed protein product [Didymodactylos carnosus]